MPTANVNRSVTLGGVSFGGSTGSVTFDGANSAQVTIPANETDYQVTWTCDVSESQIQCLDASRACTVKTNNSGTPVQTISVDPTKALIWVSGDLSGAKIFTTDVTTLYVTTTEETVFKVGSGQDLTP